MMCLDILTTALLQSHDLISCHKRLTGSELNLFSIRKVIQGQRIRKDGCHYIITSLLISKQIILVYKIPE